MTEPQAPASQRIGDALSRYEGPLLRYARGLLGDLERARDVVQDTFLQLCREDPARVDGHLPQWLFTVCRNRAVDVQRKDSRLRAVDPAAFDEQASLEPTPARRLEGEDLLRQVLEVLGTLPASQQEVLRLKFQEHLTYQQISAVTGLTVSHVGVLIHNGLKSLRARCAARTAGAPALRRAR
jgi:RNA polymerase sigma-70 factor (ECF subfamily)